MDKPQKKSERLLSLYDWVEAAVFSLIVITLIFTFVFRIARVDGTSMENTLVNNDRILLTNQDYAPARGDIVVIDRPGEVPLIKRVIAIAGDTVEIDENENRVTVNGEVLSEPYIKGITVQRDFEGVQTVPDGCVFVMGDNRSVSHDSRSSDIGFIEEDRILGKGLFRIWPLSGIGLVH